MSSLISESRSYRLCLITGTVCLLIGVFVSGCPGDPGGGVPNGPVTAREFTFDFSHGYQGFTAGFADYPPEHANIYELTSDYRTLPAPLESRSGLYISGVNRSDDLFMFFKGPVDGLTPGVRYTVSVNLEIATNVPSGCFGAGGAPGESVWIKAGASTTEPTPVREDSYLRMNIDIGNQSNSGESAVVLGNIANSRNCESPRQWELKSFDERATQVQVSVRSSGRVWLLIGVDSGFESLTETYFTRVSFTFTPI